MVLWLDNQKILIYNLMVKEMNNIGELVTG